MVSPLPRVIDRLFTFGIVDTLSIEQAQVVHLTNLLALFPVPIYIFYIFYGWSLGLLAVSGYSMGMVVISAIVIFLNGKHKYQQSKVLLFMANSVTVAGTYHVFNVDHTALLTFFPILFCYVFLFEFETERKAFLFSLGFTLVSLLACFIIPRGLSLEVTLSETDRDNSNTIHLIVAFLLTIAAVWAVMIHNRTIRTRLVQAREEAEKYSKLQSEFLANMSHEIRTPLNGVIGSAELLADTNLLEDQQEYVKSIGFSSRILLSIINNVLDLSKLEARKVTLEPVSFDLASSIQGLMKLLKPNVGSKPVVLHCKVEDSFARYVVGDENKIEQVLGNLIGNAIKFTDQGSVTISLRGRVDGAQYTVIVEVSDTGIGIPTGQQSGLFSRFYQADSSSHRKYMGTGLGLVICKSLVELMGGSIKVASNEGQGSVFTVYLPLEVAEVEEGYLEKNLKGAKSGQTSPRNFFLPSMSPKLKILVAEDNPINQMVVSRFLKNLNLEVDIANDGKEAFDKAIVNLYDLILMDIQMPNKDGIEATRDLRQHFNNPHKPIIVALTANAMKEDKDKCLSAGMNDYLSKPIRKDDIENLIQRWF